YRGCAGNADDRRTFRGRIGARVGPARSDGGRGAARDELRAMLSRSAEPLLARHGLPDRIASGRGFSNLRANARRGPAMATMTARRPTRSIDGYDAARRKAATSASSSLTSMSDIAT